jgi:hypothetical protein
MPCCAQRCDAAQAGVCIGVGNASLAAGLQILRLCKGAECGGAALLVAFGAPRAA